MAIKMKIPAIILVHKSPFIKKIGATKPQQYVMMLKYLENSYYIHLTIKEV
jgi:hypothetical protein